MTAEMQLMFNLLAGVAGFLGAFLMKNMWDTIKDLRTNHDALKTKVGEITVLVAGEYAKREDVNELGREIFRKLDIIVEKLDKKADKT